jgi:hypothetical protein
MPLTKIPSLCYFALSVVSLVMAIAISTLAEAAAVVSGKDTKTIRF